MSGKSHYNMFVINDLRWRLMEFVNGQYAATVQRASWRAKWTT